MAIRFAWMAILVGASMAGGCAAQTDRATHSARSELACAELDAEVLDRPSFRRADVVSVDPVYEVVGKQQVQRSRGAELTLRARQGTSGPWLERVARCRAASAPNEGAHDSVLGVPGVQVHVDSRGSTYVVRLTSDEVERAREIWTRVEVLGPRGV